MYISVLALFKPCLGPSSSHTLGPLEAARDFSGRIVRERGAGSGGGSAGRRLVCRLKGSLAYTGKGHGTDRAVLWGIHGWTVPQLIAGAAADPHFLEGLTGDLSGRGLAGGVRFEPSRDIRFERGAPLEGHPNGMIFELRGGTGRVLQTETYYSVGGGFIRRKGDEAGRGAGEGEKPAVPYPFDSGEALVRMGEAAGLSAAAMKRANEEVRMPREELARGLDRIWEVMAACGAAGLRAEGVLPGGLGVERRAGRLLGQLLAKPGAAGVNDWLCTYAMAVSEENAAGRPVVTAPTSGAAGVIPALMLNEERLGRLDRRGREDFLLTAAAVGGLIKHRSSISGAEVGCQGEVGSAAAMGAAGLCAAWGGSLRQVENAAEMALEHHLGLPCDPVGGLVQVPCIERNGFGAVKAYTAASLALRGSGRHVMPLDGCIGAMEEIGREMSSKFKETSLGGLAVSITEC